MKRLLNKEKELKKIKQEIDLLNNRNDKFVLDKLIDLYDKAEQIYIDIQSLKAMQDTVNIDYSKPRFVNEKDDRYTKKRYI